MNKAFEDVMAERRRQLEAEGWTSEHDDQHVDGEMARAASAYAFHATLSDLMRKSRAIIPHEGYGWPWANGWWKPTTPRRDLVKAAALLLAEIERLDRAAGISVTPRADGAKAPTARIIPYTDEDERPDNGMAGLVMLAIDLQEDGPDQVLDRIPEAAAKVICGLLNAAKAEA